MGVEFIPYYQDLAIFSLFINQTKNQPDCCIFTGSTLQKVINFFAEP